MKSPKQTLKKVIDAGGRHVTHEDRRRRKANVAASILGVMAIGLMANACSSEPGRGQEESAIEAIDNGEAKATGITITLAKGANVRSTPLMPNVSEPADDNIAFSVDSGDVLVVSDPIMYKDEATGDLWAGFQDFRQETSDETSRDSLLWVNYSQMADEANDGNPIMTVYSGDSTVMSDSLNVNFREDKGQFVVSENVRVAYGQLMNEREAEFFVSASGLQPTGQK